MKLLFNKKLFNSILLIMLVCSAVIVLQTGQASAAGKTAGKSGKLQSSFDYKIYQRQSVYKRVLSLKMSDVYNRISPSIDDDRTMPIPGLIKTYTSDAGSVDSSDNFIPQGLCSADKYLLVTAYDSSRKLKSVIYVLDAEADRLVSTLTLPYKFHVGGIAFDGSNIWLTGNTSDRQKGSYYVRYIRYEDFAEMISENLHRVTKSEMSDRIPIKNKPSFLECDDGKLWVGTFAGGKSTKEGYMYGYDIYQWDDGTRLNTTIYSVISGIDSSAQGADIDGNYLYVSSSYQGYLSNVKTSFVTKYAISPIKQGLASNLYVENREISRVEVPKMNEEILVQDGMIYINFESAAEKWRRPVIATDRILAVKTSVWNR